MSEKTEEVKLETYSEMNPNIIKDKKPYVKITEINNNLEYNKDDQNYLSKIQNPNIKNILNKLISNGASLMKNNPKENMLNQFNVNGLYLTLNKNGNKYSDNYNLSLDKLILNHDIDEDIKVDYY